MTLAFGLVLLACHPRPAIPGSPPTLVPGDARDGALAGGERRAFRAQLAAGQPYLLTAEQQGVDVELAVATPDGGRLAAVDSPQDRRGREALLVRPAKSGSFRVEVRGREPGSPSGGFRLRLEALQSGTPAERRRLAAEAAVTAAGEAYLRGSKEDRRRALAEWRRALPLWRSLGRRREAARALYAVLVLHRLVDEPQEALAVGGQAQAAWRALGDRFWEASTLNELGLDRWLRGENGAARRLFDQALALHRQAGNDYGEAVTAANLCLMDLVAGELRAGAACYERALPLLRSVEAAALEAAGETSAGRAWDILGEPRKARAHYERALELARSSGDRRAVARTLNNLGVLARETGELEGALERYGEALDRFRELGDRRWQARVLGNLGLAYYDLGEVGRARTYFEEALPLWREVEDRAGEAAALAGLGRVARHEGDLRAALAHFEKALELDRAVGDRRGEAMVLGQLGQTELELGQVGEALALFDGALAPLRALEDRAGEAAVLRYQGQIHLGRGEVAEALAALTRSLELARAAGQRASEAETLYELARAERSAGHLTRARSRVEAALAIVESLRTRIGNPDLRASYFATVHRAYELEIDLLMASHHREPDAGLDRAALETAERARSRTLLELLGEAGAEGVRGLDPALLARRRALIERLGARTERASRSRPGNWRHAAGDAVSVREEAAIRRQLDLVEADLRRRSPRWGGLNRPRTLTVSEIQRLLDPDTLLLVYSLGEERSYLWAVGSTSLASYELPPRRDLEDAARHLYRLESRFDPRTWREAALAAAALSRRLLGPVAERLGARRLAVVADGALQYLPLGALPLPGEGRPPPVVARHEVVSLPSVSVLPELRRLERRPSGKRGWLAVVADPVFGHDDPRVTASRGAGRDAPGIELPRLPGSRREARALAALAPPGETLEALGFDASRRRVLAGALAGYRVVHLATHGILDSENPSLSSLVLSRVDRRGRPQEGSLRLADVYDLHLDADLVVLSGCRTALGREVRGEGLVGLTRGFMYAGAPRVVASLWQVEDRATAVLMTRFYRALWGDGLTPAAALRRAQLALRRQRRFRDPYFWAGFVLVGDWR